jgi:hypothetical protein
LQTTPILLARSPLLSFALISVLAVLLTGILPARFELDIAYFNLKPGTTAHNTGWGSNIYSVPKRDNNYSPTFPRESILTLFNTSAEAFVADTHWSSTEGSALNAWRLALTTGDQGTSSKTTSFLRLRAFRKLAL